MDELETSAWCRRVNSGDVQVRVSRTLVENGELERLNPRQGRAGNETLI